MTDHRGTKLLLAAAAWFAVWTPQDQRQTMLAHLPDWVAPVLSLVLAKPAKTGPKLRPHSEGVPCEATPRTDRPPARDSDVFPPYCDVYMLLMPPNSMARAGSRNTTRVGARVRRVCGAQHGRAV
jgi:hypothetical protein